VAILVPETPASRHLEAGSGENVKRIREANRCDVVGVAILKYSFYDIDILINRTLVYGALTAMLAVVYFGSVTTTQATFRALTGQGRQPQLAIVVSTLVIAALFNPLKRRIQSLIDRR
jgi:hypothetical protein